MMDDISQDASGSRHGLGDRDARAAPRVRAATETWVERLPIVDRAIEHHGGAAYTSSDVSLRLCSAGGCFDIEVRTDGGLYTHTVTREDGFRVRASNDQVEMWEGGAAKPVPPEDEARRRRFVSARVYFAFLPYRLNDPGVEKLDFGIVDWEGRPLHKVRIRFGGSRAAGGDQGGETGQTSDEYMYWLDPESGEVVYFAYDFVGSPAASAFAARSIRAASAASCSSIRRTWGSTATGSTSARSTHASSPSG